MRLLAATGNPHKLEEFRRMLEPLGFQVLAPADLNCSLDVEETGETFAENARLKAETLCKRVGVGVVADDSGLCVDALGGRPGVHSARYLGEHTPHSEKIQGLLQELEGVPDRERTARFVCAICWVSAQGEALECQGICEGVIARQPRGDGGFGYDPVFLVGDKSFGELSPQEKDRVSHRGKALKQLAEMLEQWVMDNGSHSIKKGSNWMITSKQRATLRGLANTMDTILQVGKGGVTEATAKQAEDAITARELIKMRVLETSPVSSRQAAQELAERLGAEVVQVIGTRFVLYRPNPKQPKIKL